MKEGTAFSLRAGIAAPDLAGTRADRWGWERSGRVRRGDSAVRGNDGWGSGGIALSGTGWGCRCARYGTAQCCESALNSRKVPVDAGAAKGEHQNGLDR
ncbi:hypothetical protein GCM10018781_23900 [Kitasatospora indigofera]|uniref:Uncharacterized protein n=1 Tax=Kitasatospora indigofera TaxID=67307 RepID=A0A919FL76_9ACTN|nr:hypothetical protein GCM10018781_23900 [Kitasatospora indigofera]